MYTSNTEYCYFLFFNKMPNALGKSRLCFIVLCCVVLEFCRQPTHGTTTNYDSPIAVSTAQIFDIDFKKCDLGRIKNIYISRSLLAMVKLTPYFFVFARFLLQL